jgi:hypothetical protein
VKIIGLNLFSTKLFLTIQSSLSKSKLLKLMADILRLELLMNPNRGINDIHLIPIMQFVTMEMVINIHQVKMKVMVSVKDKH